jgi:3',5'-cyclic-AMP phosphodiesterase
MRMEVDPKPVHEILFLTAGARGKPETARLPILRATTPRLPDGVRSLLITSDLQGVAPSWHGTGETVLLGELLASTVHELAESIPELDALGVVLCGDLFSAPDAKKRGATGDVTRVWAAFSEVAHWVVGVQGNHDTFSRSINRLSNCALLDGNIVTFGGVRFGGVGLIAGQADKVGRRSEDYQSAAIQHVAKENPDFLLVHEGPPGDASQPGSPHVLSAIPQAFSGTLIAGHCHWQNPALPAALAKKLGFEMLNVDARAIIVTAG